jgi:hypothetical protein
MTIFYRLRFETPPTWRARPPYLYSPGTGSKLDPQALSSFFVASYDSQGYESESELLYYWRFTANHFVFATSPLRHTTNNFIFQLNTCGRSPYVTSSLTSVCVCRLPLLLVLVSAVILRSETSGIHDHILLSQIRDSPRSPHSRRATVEFSLLCRLGKGRAEGTASNNSSIFVWLFVAAETRLSRRCLATAVSSCSTIPIFSRLDTIF